MTPDLRRIEYRPGMLEAVGKADALPIKTWSPAEIPDDVRAAIRKEGILGLGGVYGDPDAGDPIEFDHLRLVLADGVVEIKVFNRGITLIFAEDERVKRIHRVLCKLDMSR